MLLQQHLEAGRIHPSDALAGSGAFIIPKVDPSVLPHWVNDYRQLNTNTITDSFPFPCILEILSDCGNGIFFASLDMTNSFVQTHMHPDDVKLIAVNTPWGLYEWVIMPMGIKNVPAIHQRCITATLHPFIGRICHVYLDDIVIWSKSINTHFQNVTTILNALKENKLYCNPKKTKLFCTKICFLGHCISSSGIEANEGKADHVTNWPVPTSVVVACAVSEHCSRAPVESPTVFVSFPPCLVSSCVCILQWIGNFPPSLIPSTAG